MKFCFPSPILKDSMFLILPYIQWVLQIDTDRSDTPISKNVSTTMSILNNVIGSLERVFGHLTELCSMPWYQDKHVSTCKISTKVSHNVTSTESGGGNRDRKATMATIKM
jgi:hypothetical protein